MASLALSQSFPIPGEQGFPLNAMYKAPANKQEEGLIIIEIFLLCELCFWAKLFYCIVLDRTTLMLD